MSSSSVASLHPILLHGVRADVLAQLGPISVVVARAHGKLMRVYDRTDLDSLGLDPATVYERATTNLEARYRDGSIRVRRGRSPRGTPLVMFEHPTLGASSLLLPELEPIVRSLLRSSGPLAAALIRRDLLVVYVDDGAAREVERWLDDTTPPTSEMTVVRLAELSLRTMEMEIPVEWEEPEEEPEEELLTALDEPMTEREPPPGRSSHVELHEPATRRAPWLRDSDVELHDTITEVRAISPFRNLAPRRAQRLSLNPRG